MSNIGSSPRLRLLPVLMLAGGLAVPAQADFFDRLRKAVEEVVVETAEEVVIETASDLIREMIIGHSSRKTRTEEEVSEEYEEEQGELPRATVLASYRSEILPGDAVSPGTEVRVESVIEVIPGTDGKRVTIEEKLTIYDNEDNSRALKSLSKKAGKRSDRGGEFASEFNFTLPEGLPQGVYPIRTTLSLNGELVGDRAHDLQLVWLGGAVPPGGSLALASGGGAGRE